MLKVRLIPTIVLKGDQLVQSIGFNKFLPIGKIDAAIEFFNNWDVDEIIIIDIDATKEKRGPFLSVIEKAAKKCFVPLTIGGGINKLSQVKDLLNVGADKVCINTAAFENSSFISEITGIYGSQFVTVSVDVKKVKGTYSSFVRNGSVNTNLTAEQMALKAVQHGAGEILLHFIDRDGSKQGYDIELTKTIREKINVPLIVSGGAGKFSHFVEAIQAGKASAVAAGNIFQFTELSTVAAKSFMKKAGLPIRIDSEVQYENYRFDILDRPI
jgi:imidazole glycerol-phosphate synthase subunit HisF